MFKTEEEAKVMMKKIKKLPLTLRKQLKNQKKTVKISAQRKIKREQE